MHFSRLFSLVSVPLIRRLCVIGLLSLLPYGELAAFASPNFHLVGWFNALVPGGGQLLLGNYTLASTQAILEAGTFGTGYAMSARYPMTIDGVPEDLPTVGGTNVRNTVTASHCSQWGFSHGKRVCLTTSTTSTSTTTLVLDATPQDFRKPLYADLLQEFGLKYHMINAFTAYREAARSGGGTNQMIDNRDISAMFLDPFRPSNLLNPWVIVPMAVIAGAATYDYFSTIRNGISPIEPMNKVSNNLFAFNYEVWQPFGSGVPEEVFYRGFLQNEFYDLISSPFFSIPMSAAAFSLSHSSSGRVGAAIAGTYLGFLAHKYHGNLGPGITVHFWGVVMLGIETALLSRKAQGATPPPGFQVQMNF